MSTGRRGSLVKCALLVTQRETDYHVPSPLQQRSKNACGHSSIPVLILTQELTGNSSVVKQLADNRCVIMLMQINHDTLTVKHVTTGTVNSKM